MKDYLSIALLFITVGVYSQAVNSEKPSKSVVPLNNLSVNLLGDLCMFSVRYERLHPISGDNLVTARIGAGYAEALDYCNDGLCNSNVTYTTFTHGISYLSQHKSIFVEIGLGGTAFFANNIDQQGYTIYPVFGLRYHPSVKPMMHFNLYGYYPTSIGSKAANETQLYARNTVPIKNNLIYYIPIGFSFGLSF